MDLVIHFLFGLSTQVSETGIYQCVDPATFIIHSSHECHLEGAAVFEVGHSLFCFETLKA